MDQMILVWSCYFPNMTKDRAMDNELTKNALHYAEHGWYIFPLKPRSKEPLTTNGFYNATCDPEQVRAWWSEYPDANIGVDLGRTHLVAIDIDAKDGGLETWQALDPQIHTLVARTGTGGFHVYYRNPNGERFLNKRIATGIDLKNEGGYVVLPPSVHPNGNPYQWEVSDTLADLPPVLIPRLPLKEPPAPREPVNMTFNALNHPYAKAALEDETNKVLNAPLHNRNNQLNASALALGKLVAGGALDESEVIDALLTAALQAGLDEGGSVRTIASGMRKGKTEPRGIPDATPQIKKETEMGQDVSQDTKKKTHRAAKTWATSEDFLSALSQLGYQFRMNRMDDTLEVNGVPIDDPLRAEIRTRMRDAGFKGMLAIEDAYMTEAKHNGYHPIQDYLKSLTWDGRPHIATLAGYFENPDKALPVWLHRWLVGAVAKAFYGTQNMMLMLDGPQGAGKSTFARWLCPLSDRYSDSRIDADDKDSELRLLSLMVWEIGEVGNTFRKQDREALKQFITKLVVRQRRSYGHFDTAKPAVASLIGTFNDEGGVLSDPTGNRRFLICKVQKIDYGYTEMDLSQVWAEAAHYAFQGETGALTDDEKKLQTSVNETYEIDDPVVGLLAKHFFLDKNDETWTTTTEINRLLEAGGLHNGTTKANHMAIAAALCRLGHKRERRAVNGVRTVGYLGVIPKSM